jgi:eukaryotic-like serine/threonine-protein kinase
MLRPDSASEGMILEGRWELIHELGRGGASTVWFARELADPEAAPAAVKLLLPELRLVESVRQRFSQEAALLAELAHPAIVRALDWRLEGDRPYIVMEYREGARLDQELRARREDAAHFPRALLGRIMQQLLGALEHAHDRGIVHRDLKPINLILSSDGLISVLDFGIARLVGESDQTTIGRVIGTYRYMSPEQMLAKPIDRRSDLFSLGVLLYELLTLERAWPGNLPAPELCRQVCQGPRPAPSAARRELDPAFDAFLARVTAIDPDERPATALAFWAELEPLLDLLDPPLDDRTRALALAPPASRRRTSIAQWSVLVATCLAMVVLGMLLARPPEPPLPPLLLQEPEPLSEPVLPPEARALEVPAPPPLAPPPPPPVIRRVRPPRPSPPPPPSGLERARALIAAAEGSPGDAVRFRAASSAVLDAVAQRAAPSAVRRLRRLVEVAEVSYDHAALRRILEELDHPR